MGRMADLSADYEIIKSLERLGDDSLQAFNPPSGLGRVQLIWCRRNIPSFEELHNKSIAVGREPEMDDDA